MTTTTTTTAAPVAQDCTKINCGLMSSDWLAVNQSWKITNLQELMNTEYKTPEQKAQEALEKQIADAVKAKEEEAKRLIQDNLVMSYHTARHFYGGSAAALAVYAAIMLGIVNPKWEFQTFWDAGVLVNFLVGMIASVPLVVMWILTLIFNDEKEDYMINYVFFFIAFINSWHLITSFWISVALMVASYGVETRYWYNTKIEEEEEKNVPKEDRVVWREETPGAVWLMITNMALGGVATALTYMNKVNLYNWFVWTFPGQLEQDDILQAMNTEGEDNPIFDAQKVGSKESIEGATNDPVGTASDQTGVKAPTVPSVPSVPDVPTVPTFKSDEWEYEF